MTKPNLFVVGAPKAGSTSLYHILSAQHSVFMSPIKEVHYYSSDIDIAKFSKEYRETVVADDEKALRKSRHTQVFSTHVRKEWVYAALFEGAKQAKHRYVGEVSPSYLYSRVAAKAIAQDRPGSKIVMILRNPVERAYSHYLMDLRIGYIRSTFSECIEDELEREDRHWGRDTQYIELGMYTEQVRRYFDVFPESDIEILVYDDYKRDNEMALQHLLGDFLGIDDPVLPERKRYNVAQVPRFPRLNHFMRQNNVKRLVGEWIPEPVKDFFRPLFYQHDRLPALSDRDRMALVEIFRNDVEALSDLIKRDLTFWLTQDQGQSPGKE